MSSALKTKVKTKVLENFEKLFRRIPTENGVTAFTYDDKNNCFEMARNFKTEIWVPDEEDKKWLAGLLDLWQQSKTFEDAQTELRKTFSEQLFLVLAHEKYKREFEEVPLIIARTFDSKEVIQFKTGIAFDKINAILTPVNLNSIDLLVEQNTRKYYVVAKYKDALALCLNQWRELKNQQLQIQELIEENEKLEFKFQTSLYNLSSESQEKEAIVINANSTWKKEISDNLGAGQRIHICLRNYLAKVKDVCDCDDDFVMLQNYEFVSNQAFEMTKRCQERINVLPDIAAEDYFRDGRVHLIRGFIPPNKTDLIYANNFIEKREKLNIANTLSEMKNDEITNKKRYQSPEMEIDELEVPIAAVAHAVLSKMLQGGPWKIEDIRVLKSEKNTARQQSHYDCNVVAVKSANYRNVLDGLNLNTKCSYSFILALQNGTTLDCYDSNLQLHPVKLNAGDIVIWMANQLHGGSEYEESDTRLFGRFIVPEQPMGKNEFQYCTTDTTQREPISSEEFRKAEYQTRPREPVPRLRSDAAHLTRNQSSSMANTTSAGIPSDDRPRTRSQYLNSRIDKNLTLSDLNASNSTNKTIIKNKK
jgi:regulator of replication initiation timing